MILSSPNQGKVRKEDQHSNDSIPLSRGKVTLARYFLRKRESDKVREGLQTNGEGCPRSHDGEGRNGMDTVWCVSMLYAD